MDRRDFTDWDLQALVDNELDWETRKQVLRLIDHDPSARRRYDELRTQKKSLLGWWRALKKH